jgi:D-alanyl-D-alanine-carboxypeptidase/D-alanyl-D-alanine-endopeptidase
MVVWLKYLLGTAAPAIPAQNPAAQAVYVLPANLKSTQGLDHAGDPTGIGLGWIHLLPADSPSHIVEKTGGGAGFSTYIAINHARRTAIFVAATDGPIDTHQNLFKAANDLLLAVAGLPPLPPPPPKPTPKRRRVPQNRVPHPSSLGWAQPTRSTFYVLR